MLTGRSNDDIIKEIKDGKFDNEPDFIDFKPFNNLMVSENLKYAFYKIMQKDI